MKGIVSYLKKIGIITINDYSNYGNRLQNYATQEVLRSLGYEVETIVNSPYKKQKISDMFNKAKKMQINELIIKVFRKIRYKLFKNSDEKKNKMLDEIRINKFRNFTNENISETPYVISNDNMPSDLGEKYSAFIVGSDQVWNPNFRMSSFIDFLTFAPKKKRIAYAASFGISTLPEEYVYDYSRWLSEMEHISVREDTGAKIVKKLTGKNVEVLIDPTLMLTKEQWLSISRPAICKPDKSYLLTYFLGGISSESRVWINSIVKNTDLDIVNLADIEDERRYIADPAEFLDYINSCEAFLTDSFHGVAFSILFKKPFIIFERNGDIHSMNSRIDTLLSKFKLEERKYENIKNNNEVFTIDYSHVPRILESERKKALDYLKNSLDIKGAK